MINDNIKEIYGDLVDELDDMVCIEASLTTYKSNEEPGNCLCSYCSIHRISDRLWALCK